MVDVRVGKTGAPAEKFLPFQGIKIPPVVLGRVGRHLGESHYEYYRLAINLIRGGPAMNVKKGDLYLTFLPNTAGFWQYLSLSLQLET